MSAINLSFHALPEEQLEILRQWRPTHRDVLVVAMYWLPTFKVIEFDFDEVLRTPGFPKRICLGFEPLRRGAESMYQFMIDNLNWTAWDIGELNEDGLRESQFSASTNNATHAKTWISLANQIRKATTAGMWVINPETGAKQFYKQCRFSPGAAAISRSGKKLLPVAGWNYYEIDVT
jgi:hypothetical protein